tara:strand:- start:186 stop:938 length:753 start_codon:yes stop_codon:yes gene_type:complete
MINKKLLSEFMSTSPASLKEFSEFINKLIKEHGRETIINTAGIDKNVLYRASNSQNITLDNYYKIKKAFSNQISTPSAFIEQLPLLGQIINNTKVRLLNPSQPTTVPVPRPLITAWTPVLGYIHTSGTAYSGFVHIFSTRDLETECKSIHNKCVNRIIMTYPEDDNPEFGMLLKTGDEFILIHPETRKVIRKIPVKNNISWAKWICLIPYSLMENFQEPTPAYADTLVKLEEKFHKTCGDEHIHTNKDNQ